MVLDVDEERSGTFHLWGTISGTSVLARIQDFLPYLYVAAPTGKVRLHSNQFEVLCRGKWIAISSHVFGSDSYQLHWISAGQRCSHRRGGSATVTGNVEQANLPFSNFLNLHLLFIL